MTTLLVLYRAPEGGAEALATFERRYATSTCRSSRRRRACARSRVWRVDEALGGETDLVLVAAMDFDDRAALDEGLRSDPMRAAGRILREIAPGLATFLVRRGRAGPARRSERRRPRKRSAGVDTVRATEDRRPKRRRRCHEQRRTSPCRRPAADGPVDGVALVVDRPARGAQRPRLRAASTS